MVSPSFFKNDPNRLLIHVQVKSSDFQNTNASIQNVPASQSVFQKTEDEVISKVVMNFGETLILSGISTRTVNSTRTGTPFMKNIPVVGYLFGSRGGTKAVQSTIILLTPHKKEFAYTDRSGQVRKQLHMSEKDLQPRLDELKVRLKKRFVVPECVSHEMTEGLKLPDFTREFRVRDVYPGFQEPRLEYALISSYLVV